MLLACSTTQGADAQARASIPVPGIDARSYLLIDHRSGAILAEHEADQRVEPASITKIMTIYVAAHALDSGLIDITDEVVVSEKAWKMEGSRMFIEPGEKVTVDALLDGIIVQSGNDASVALAEHVSGSEEIFASVMNEHAHQLGMTNSNFANSSGLPDPMTYVTARDVVRLSSALIREFPDLYARFAKKEYTFNGIRQPNRNRLLERDASVDGIKTGHTENAGYCLVTSASRNTMRLIAAVMGTNSDSARTKASQTLLNYGFRFFESRQLYAADDVVISGKVWRGVVDQVTAVPDQTVHITIPRGSYDKLKAVAHLDEPIKAPLSQGQPIGHIEVTLDGEELVNVTLTAREKVGVGGFFARTYDDIMMLFE